MRIFAPLLAGATFRDRVTACLGALLGLGVTGLVCLNLPLASQAPLLVAPMGASAVLVFAVPASPLAQPWAVIGGNAVSALVGVAVGHLVPFVPLAAGLSVALAILAMSLLRCLHPPGGAAALTAVIGGPAVTASGFLFPFVPVALNSVVLVLAALLFHRFSGHSYPHRPVPAPAPAPAIAREDLDRALEEVGESFDVSREDLQKLFERVAFHAGKRNGAGARTARR